MGGSRWSEEAYVSSVACSVDSHGTAFHYDKDVRSGVLPAAVAPTLDPSKMRVDARGLKVRESRDSEAHPNSNAIIIGLDVTGSMASVVRVIHEKLPTLMGLITRKDYIPDPQLLFCAIGDATCDKAPLQLGQFESGAEMESVLGNFFLEGGGGAYRTESYELLAYVGARHTSIDCLEKRGKKGYAFIIGDEMNYPKVSKVQVQNLMDAGLQEDVDTKEIYEELKKKYEVFFILPLDASGGSDTDVIAHWGKLVGPQNVLRLEKAEAIAELIATQIGLCEGTIDVERAAEDLKENGTSTALVKAVTGSVSKAYAGGSISRITPGTLPPSSSEPSDTKRL